MSDDEFYLEDSSEEEEEEDGEEGFEIDDGLQFSGEEGVDSVGGMQVAPPPTSYQTLTPDMISKKMFDIIHEVNAVFQLPTPHVRILLTTCKWDKEKLLERYYAGDQEELFRQAHLVHPQRRRPQPNPPNLKAQLTATCGAAASPGQEYICDVCMMSYPLSEMSGLECGHLFCRQCWNSYLCVMIMCEGRGQTISCQATSCDIVVDEATVLELLCDAEVKQKYQLLITNSFVQDHPHLKWCPSPGCPNAVLTTTMDHSPVTCSCGHSFCFKCSRDAHEPILCEYLKLWLKKCDDDSETSNWIHCNTKECPKCHATIEKNGGCNHMHCSTCKAEFCWVCLGPWEPHGSSWYHCNRYNEHDALAARSAQARSREALERYLFYCNRYMNHLKSSRMEHKLYETAHQRMQEMQQLNMSWIEVRLLLTPPSSPHHFSSLSLLTPSLFTPITSPLFPSSPLLTPHHYPSLPLQAQFLKRAVDVLCQCRQTLMYTYAFAYYLKKNNHTYIFEDNQRDLEMATEMLSEYLERDLSRDSLTDMKIFVQDKTKYCEARRKVVLDHVYEGYDQDFWEYVLN